MIDPAARLRDFPLLQDSIYLNTAAEGLSPIHVGAALNDYWQHRSQGSLGRDQHESVAAECREIAGQLLGLSASEIAFCPSVSEAANLLFTAINLRPVDEVVVTDIDFPSAVSPWIGERTRRSIQLWKAHNGGLRRLELLRVLSPRTRLVQIPLVSPITGARIRWRETVDTIRALAPEAIIAADITHGLGRFPLTECADADVLFAAGHTFALGLHGLALVAMPADKWERLTPKVGGWHQMLDPKAEDWMTNRQTLHGAQAYSIGTPGYASIYALNAALRYLDAVGIDSIAQQADPLVLHLIEGLRLRGLRLLHLPAEGDALSGIVSFYHSAPRDLHAAFRKQGIETHQGRDHLRLSVHGYNTLVEVEQVLHALDKILLAGQT
jgi:cysteine desulfurase / selenocysteine lyase